MHASCWAPKTTGCSTSGCQGCSLAQHRGGTLAQHHAVSDAVRAPDGHPSAARLGIGRLQGRKPCRLLSHPIEPNRGGTQHRLAPRAAEGCDHIALDPTPKTTIQVRLGCLGSGLAARSGKQAGCGQASSPALALNRQLNAGKYRASSGWRNMVSWVAAAIGMGMRSPKRLWPGSQRVWAKIKASFCIRSLSKRSIANGWRP